MLKKFKLKRRLQKAEKRVYELEWQLFQLKDEASKIYERDGDPQSSQMDWQLGAIMFTSRELAEAKAEEQRIRQQLREL